LAKRVVVVDANFPGVDRERTVAARYGAHFVEARCSSPEEVVEAARDADVLMVQFARVTSKVMDRLVPNAAIVRYGLGLDNIDLIAARQRGIRVAYVPDYATGEVADHTAALLLASLRKILPLDRSVREGLWDPVGVAQPIRPFADSTLGFVGFGRIGREVHARMRAFGFKAIVADPLVNDSDLRSLGAMATDIDTVFRTSDAVTLHVPLTEETTHVVNAHRLSSMKSTAVIVNTARGGLIDSVALEHALVSGAISGAALDVFEDEPLPSSSRLRTLANVLLTPHVAWYSSGSSERVQSLAADELERALAGKPARCPAPT
jgi:D-3-phosphoglycerate dehydrogenase / 2-oxoglutarate reductase